MAHVAKFIRGTCGLLSRHYDRYKDKEHPEEVKYKNQDIDPERTHLNYNLAPMREQMPYLKKRLEEVHCLKRDDVNVMCDWVVTAPKELPAEHQREFFEVVYKHLADKYGEKNVISAYVHMDEKQPHMHFAFVPVVYDVKKGKEKVSAKEALNRSQLKRFHPELQKVIDNWIEEKEYDFECNVLNGATENGNKTIEELKIESLKEIRKEEEYLTEEANTKCNEAWGEVQELENKIHQLEEDAEKAEKLKAEVTELEVKRDDLKSEASELSAQISEADKKLETINKAKDKAENSLKSTQKDVQAREMYLGVLNSSEIEKVQNRARENVLSKIQGKDEVILDKTDYMNLLRTAKLVDELKRKMDKMAAAYKAKIKEAENLLAAAKEKAREIVKGAKGESMQMRLDQAKDEIALERYKALENKFPDVFKEMRNQVAHEKGRNIIHNHDEFER